jgi:hypothetical protein
MKKRTFLTIATLALAACAAGCGASAGTARPPDREAARQALRTALDAWKSGEKYNALASATSPIRVADEDWLAGVKLVDYQIESKEDEIGSRLACSVVLTIQDPKGRPARRQVVYNVATEPTPSIIRQD